jgi:hypothetical protein
MTSTMTARLVALAVLVGAAPAVAHHSFSSEYDQNKPVTLTGVVSKMEWLNPHARFYIDVKDATGKVTTWNFELASVNSLRRNGWTPTSLRAGDVITAKGYAAIAGIPMAAASTVTLADGTSLFAETNSPNVQQTPQR